MKKLNVLLVVGGLLLTNLVFASNGDLFQIDKEKINQEMAQLNELESFVLQNQDITYDDMLEAGNLLVMNLNTESSTMMPGMINTPILPPFWWGCILGPVGVLLVWILEDDPPQTKSAFWGCLISTLIWGAGSWYWWL